MTTGLWIALAVLGAAVLFGGYRRVTDGRARATADSGNPLVALAGQGAGTRATLVQFSAPVCAPCEAAKRVLTGVVAKDPTIGHVDVDAESHLDLVRELGIKRTPTVLVLDSFGVEHYRIHGVPRAGELERALSTVGGRTAHV